MIGKNNSSDASKILRDTSNSNPYEQNFNYGIRGDASATVRGSLVALNTFNRHLESKGFFFSNYDAKGTMR
jgi:hypothetical protein